VLDGVISDLRAAWPATAWDEARVRPLVDAADPVALSGPHRTDLLWAWACLACDSDALAALESGPITGARAHLRTLGLSAAVIDDAVQRALSRLVADRAALATYRGRGSLDNFVRTIVVRHAFDEQHKTPRTVELTDAFATPSPDPELEYMRKLYAEHIAAAFRDAWGKLGAHERFLLALQLYEGMTIDDLGRVYSIHRASAARRAAAARSSLLGHIRACLRERLAVTDDTLDSILRIVTTSVHLPIEPVS
jgi:RNA polymerase sigma-70 factor, ECF subfamily